MKKKTLKAKSIFKLILIAVIVIAAVYAYRCLSQYLRENEILKQVISRLEAESRIAQVLVSKVEYDEAANQNLTTIKFLEFDAEGKPLDSRYFTFSGNIIQFQSLVIRFDDIKIKAADKLQGKSAYLFWKVFMLDGADTQEYVITPLQAVPKGYRVSDNKISDYEMKLWGRFWDYALNPREAERVNIKNAQIEAPGTTFVPGIIYTIKIEHDGGMRIDAQPLPEILKGENIPQENLSQERRLKESPGGN